MDDSKNKIGMVGGLGARTLTLDEEIASLPTREQVSNFVQGNFAPGDIAEVRYIDRATGKSESFWCLAGELPQRVPQMQRLNGAGFDIYVGANPRKGFNLAGDTNVALARCQFVDQDANNGFTTIEALADHIANSGLPEPTMLLASGHGGWAYWRLREAATDLAVWRAVQVGLAAKLGTDNKVVNPERIGRLPGFWNLKEPKAWAWLHTIDTTRAYPAETFAPFATMTAKPAPARRAINTTSDSHAMLVRRARMYIAGIEGRPVGNGQPGRNSLIFGTAGNVAAIVGDGGEVLSEGEIIELLRDLNARCAPPLDDVEMVKAVRSGMRNGKARPPKPPRINRWELGMRCALEASNV